MALKLRSSWPKPKLTSWVGGTFAASNANAETYNLVRSATNEIVGSYECATAEVVSDAIERARTSQQQWKKNHL